MAQIIRTEEPTVIKEREVVHTEAPRRSATGTILLLILILFVIYALFAWHPWGSSGGSTNINVPTPTVTQQ